MNVYQLFFISHHRFRIFPRKWNYIAAKRVLRGNDDDERKGRRLRTWISTESEVKLRQHSIHIRTHSVALCIHIRFDWLWNFIRWWGGEKRKKFNARIPSFAHQKPFSRCGVWKRRKKKPTEEKNVMLIRRVNKIYHFSSSRFRASEAVRERKSAAVEQQWAHIKIAESCEICAPSPLRFWCIAADSNELWAFN